MFNPLLVGLIALGLISSVGSSRELDPCLIDVSNSLSGPFHFLGGELNVKSDDQSQNAGNALVGTSAPNFDGRTVDGKQIKLSDFRGRIVVLDFMASWCGICRATMPETRKLYDRTDRSKVEFVSISLDGGENTDTTLVDLKRFVERQRMNWAVVFDGTGLESAIARDYNVKNLPVNVVIDREGVIRLITRDGGSKGVKQLQVAIDRLK